MTLYTNGLRYLEKAPLMYWGLAGSYELFGISDWSTRLPLMLAMPGHGACHVPARQVRASANAADFLPDWLW